VLILHGENDTTVPASAARRLAHALESAHAPYELHIYPQAGHLFDRGGFSPGAAFGKNPRLTGLAGRDTGDGAADTDAFTQTLRFLEANLH
jgi:dienelactone hydrolase